MTNRRVIAVHLLGLAVAVLSVRRPLQSPSLDAFGLVAVVASLAWPIVLALSMLRRARTLEKSGTDALAVEIRSWAMALSTSYFLSSLLFSSFPR
jgi:hypothetical protein